MVLAATTQSFHTAARLMDLGARGPVSSSRPVRLRSATTLLAFGRFGKATVLRRR